MPSGVTCERLLVLQFLPGHDNQGYTDKRQREIDYPRALGGQRIEARKNERSDCHNTTPRATATWIVVNSRLSGSRYGHVFEDRDSQAGHYATTYHSGVPRASSRALVRPRPFRGEVLSLSVPRLMIALLS